MPEDTGVWELLWDCNGWSVGRMYVRAAIVNSVSSSINTMHLNREGFIVAPVMEKVCIMYMCREEKYVLHSIETSGQSPAPSVRIAKMQPIV